MHESGLGDGLLAMPATSATLVDSSAAPALSTLVVVGPCYKDLVNTSIVCCVLTAVFVALEEVDNILSLVVFCTADTDAITAKVNNGVLEIEIPKKKQAKDRNRRIQVSGDTKSQAQIGTTDKSGKGTATAAA